MIGGEQEKLLVSFDEDGNMQIKKGERKKFIVQINSAK